MGKQEAEGGEVAEMRLDRTGRDLTELSGLWDEPDCEIVTTQFRHPSIKSGPRTNGPPTIWIRLPDGGVDWIRCRERSLRETVQAWIDMGIEWFQEVAAESADKE